MNVAPERQLAILRAGLCVHVPMNLLAQKIGCSTKECDLILWRRLGTMGKRRGAAVTSLRFEHNPRRQAMGREPPPRPGDDEFHLASIRGGFPTLGPGAP
jgi:hypothetical protein